MYNLVRIDSYSRLISNLSRRGYREFEKCNTYTLISGLLKVCTEGMGVVVVGVRKFNASSFKGSNAFQFKFGQSLLGHVEKGDAAKVISALPHDAGYQGRISMEDGRSEVG